VFKIVVAVAVPLFKFALTEVKAPPSVVEVANTVKAVSLPVCISRVVPKPLRYHLLDCQPKSKIGIPPETVCGVVWSKVK
jgi:hypothetical protein